MHTAHVSRRVSLWIGLWSGSRYCRCYLWLHCRIWSHLHLELLDEATNVASSCWRWLSLLFRRKDFPVTPTEQAVPAKGIGLFSAYASTFFLTLSNPVTILSFAAIFAGLGVGSTGGSYAPAAMLVFGVFSGSALWWLILSGSVSLFRTRFTQAGLRWVNRVSGMIITGFGVIALLSLIL